MILFDCVLLCYYGAAGTLGEGSSLPPHRPQWEVEVLHIVVSLCYIGGNVIFIRAMRLQSQTLVRFAIVANIDFAIALFAAFVYFIVEREDAEGVPYSLRVLRLVCIAGFLTCQAIAGYIYSRLWRFYENDLSVTDPFVATRAIFAKTFLVIFSAVLVVGVFYAIADPTVGTYVWSALIGF